MQDNINRTYPTGNWVSNYQRFKANVLEKRESALLLRAYSLGALQRSTGCAMAISGLLGMNGKEDTPEIRTNP